MKENIAKNNFICNKSSNIYFIEDKKIALSAVREVPEIVEFLY